MTVSPVHPVIIISGATATGKTGIAPQLANFLKSKTNKQFCVVNFDSLLFYRELNIGTAKPSAQEQAQCEHFLIDVASAKNPINAADYIKLANPLIEEIQAQDKGVILVGGSAFYLRALIKGMYPGNSSDEELQQELQKFYQAKGIGFFHDYLKIHDPKSCEQLHINDHYRIMRAVEYHKLTGEKFSDARVSSEQKNPYDFDQHSHSNWKLFHLYLSIPKEQHWPIILKRTQVMLKDGLIEEVQKLLAQGFNGEEKPLQSIGYKETQLYLKNEIKDLAELEEKIYIATRRLAKSQRTFFNKIRPKHQFHPLEQTSELFNKTLEFVQSCL